MSKRSKTTNSTITLVGIVTAAGIGLFYVKNQISIKDYWNQSTGISLSSSNEHLLTIIAQGQNPQILNSQSTNPLATTLSNYPAVQNSSSAHTTTPSNGYKSDITKQLHSFIDDDNTDEAKLTAEIVKSLQQHNQSTIITSDIQSKIDAAKEIKKLIKEHKAIGDAINILEQTKATEDTILTSLQTNHDQQKTVLNDLNILSSANTANINKYNGVDFSSEINKSNSLLSQIQKQIKANETKTSALYIQIKITAAEQAQLVIDMKSQQQKMKVTEDKLQQNALKQFAFILSPNTNTSNITQKLLTDEFNALSQEQTKHNYLWQQHTSQTNTLQASLDTQEKEQTTFEKELADFKQQLQDETQKLNELQKQQTEHNDLLKKQKDYDAQLIIEAQKYTTAYQKLATQQASIAQIQANIHKHTKKQTKLTTQQQPLRKSLIFTS